VDHRFLGYIRCGDPIYVVASKWEVLSR